jgi:hypothetical protein
MSNNVSNKEKSLFVSTALAVAASAAAAAAAFKYSTSCNPLTLWLSYIIIFFFVFSITQQYAVFQLIKIYRGFSIGCESWEIKAHTQKKYLLAFLFFPITMFTNGRLMMAFLLCLGFE